MRHRIVRRLAVASCICTAHCVVTGSPAGTSDATGGPAETGTADVGEATADDDDGSSTGASDGATDTAAGDSSTGTDTTDTEPADTGDDDPTGVDPDTILWAADFDDASFPLYGFTYEAMSEGYSAHEAVVGGGPSGEDICSYEMLPNEQSMQPYFGWSKQDLPTTPMGEARYIRLLVRVQSPCDAVGLDDVWTDKFVMLGDGTQDPWGGIGRVIVMLGDPFEGEVRAGIMRNVDGAEHGTEWVMLECGTWHWLQWEVRSSSDLETADGGFKFWVDDDNAGYDTPTRTSPQFVLVSDTGEATENNVWNNIALGFFAQTSVASGNIGFDFAAFEYGTAFDPSWHE